MRSSWITIGPKSNDMCLYKRQKRRRYRGTQGKEELEVEIGVI